MSTEQHSQQQPQQQPQVTSSVVCTTEGRPAWYDKTGAIREPLLITVCGPTSSGKSALASAITALLNMPWVATVRLDSFLRPIPAALLADEARLITTYDLDSPAAYDFDAAVAALQAIKRGQRTVVPHYDARTHTFDARRHAVVCGVDVVLFVGTLALYDARIAALSDIKLFTASDCDTRLSARLRRDVGVLHRSVVDVLRQYELFVKPATETYVLPLQKRADIIVPGGASNRVVVDLIVREAQRILAARGWEPPSDADLDGDEFFSGSGGGGGAPGRLPDTVEQLPQSTVVRAMQTALRARTTSHDDFVFYSDALCSMLVETALSRLPYAPRAVTTPTGAAYAGEACTARICGVSLMRSGASMEAPLRRICKGIRLGKILINSENRARPSLIYVKLPPVDGHKVLLLDPMLTSGATASMALHVLVDHGVAPDDIYFLTHIASVQGIRAVCRQFPRVHIIAGIIDTTNLAKQNYLVAGMGYQPERYYC